MEGLHSLEVRWIFRGRAGVAVAGWFSSFPATVESREDSYLVHQELSGLSVKIRGGKALEVKLFGGSPGVLEVPDRALGRLETWQKWSFPIGPAGQGGDAPVAWMPVRKRISRFSLASGCIPARGPRPVCAVELTEIDAGGEAWWTVGFEATGRADSLHQELKATAALVFAEAVPEGIRLDLDHSQSYAEWLCRQSPGRGDVAGAVKGES
jgi:hypothetical protein